MADAPAGHRLLLTLAEVATMLSLSESHMREEIKAGHFPRGLQVGKRSVRWTREDVDYYLYRLRRFGESTALMEDEA